MTTLNKSEVLSETRAIARQLGMTFRVDDSIMINNEPAYELIDRETGARLAKTFTLDLGYENALSGYFSKVAEENNCKPKMYHRIMKAVKKVAEGDEWHVQRTEGFARQVCLYMNKKGVNIVDSGYAQRMLNEVLDDYFA